MSLDSFAWQLTQLSGEKKRPLLVITKHNRELNQLKQIIQFLHPTLSVLSFPDWEILPYDHLSPSFSQITQRLETLSRVSHFSEGIILTTFSSLIQRIAPRDYIDSHVFEFTIKNKIDLTLQTTQLIQSGYQRVETVTMRSEFAVRGDLIDIFPVNTAFPFRIHLNIDSIEHLYYFDPVTQKPHAPIQSIHLIPSREFLLSFDSVQLFQQQGIKALGSNFTKSIIYSQLSPTSYAAGTEYYLPLFFKKTHNLLNYLPAHTHWLSAFNLSDELDSLWKYIESRYNQFSSDIQWPILPPEKLYYKPYELISQLKAFKAAAVDNLSIHPLPDLAEQGLEPTLLKVKHFLETLSIQSSTSERTKVLFCTTRLSIRETLSKKLADIGVKIKHTATWSEFLTQAALYQISIAPFKKGFWIKQKHLIIIPETSLYHLNAVALSNKTSDIPKFSTKETFNDLSQLTLNDPVVHIDHGIGRYLGLQSIEVEQQPVEFIMLAYAENTKLYVPIQDIQYISRYTGAENPPLHTLSSKEWKKTKQKAFTQLKDTAAELLKLYVQRNQSKSERFKAPNADYKAFAEAFAFEETPDQKKAIHAIVNDLCSDKPMDRLICGDVGFGKTEVAMRAAFLAVQADKQVAILAPTTLLVEQHYRNFKERFNDWPIKIDWLSRFRTLSATRSIHQALSEGGIDILIGTHALLSKQTTFKNLGLLIIDEEHHFGVQQKERLTTLKTHINVLTLTATPIPRTLQTALSGLRDFSLITTPPPGRLPIKNFIVSNESVIIREAILRELSRGGQVYFVHNRIQSLSRTARELKALVPEANLCVAHGQLSEQELEACMESFYQQQHNILVCTSIIETGIDIPTVNTLIVDKANHFGLAQLHQLRGRIGRSHHQAYAYFLVPSNDQLTSSAGKRLEALERLTQLGSGFNLASYDLDIRGAGELLGKAQSGVMQGVGFSLYMELLEKTIEAMKTGNEPNILDNMQAPLLDLKIPAFIPHSYLSNISKRLEYYVSITNAKNIDALNQIQMELIDRYGLFPQEVKNLFAINTLKPLAQLLGIKKIEAKTHSGFIEFSKQANINLAYIIELIQKEPKRYKLVPSAAHLETRLHFNWDTHFSAYQKIEYLQNLLEKLSNIKW